MVAAGAAVFAAGVFVLGGKLVYSSWTDAQIEKNNLLKKEIVKLDAPGPTTVTSSPTSSDEPTVIVAGALRSNAIVSPG